MRQRVMASVSKDRTAAAAEAQISRVRLDRLLETDRAAAGERRENRRVPTLNTAEYVPSWASRWRTFCRENHYVWRRVCEWWSPRRAVALVLAMAAAGMAALVAPWIEASSAPVHVAVSSEPLRVRPVSQGSEAQPAAERPHATRSPAPAAAAAAPESPVAPAVPAPEAAVGSEQDPKLSRWIAELSPRLRVVRADVLLDNRHPISDRRALGLLDSVVAAGAAGPHTQAARAEACLRLSEYGCALEAIDAAIELRPWRGGYRTLQRRIQRAARRAAAAR